MKNMILSVFQYFSIFCYKNFNNYIFYEIIRSIFIVRITIKLFFLYKSNY